MWDGIEKFYCINLKNRDDKYLYVSQVFRELGLPVKILRVDKHPTSGAQGCFESHVGIVKKSYLKNRKNVCIFEDDIFPNNVHDFRVKQVTDFIKNNNNWDLFYLGLCPYFFSRPKRVGKGDLKDTFKDTFKDIYQVRNLCTHAYVINNKYMAVVKDWVYSGTPIDSMYIRNKNSYGIYPSLFYQNNTTTDIQLDDKGRIGKLFERFVYNNKPFLMKMAERTYFNRELLLTVILLIIIYIFIIYIIGRKNRGKI